MLAGPRATRTSHGCFRPSARWSLLPQHRNLKLVVVGGKYGKYGMTDAQLQTAIDTFGLSGSVICPGPVNKPNELSAWYGFAELLVFPSLTRTFGLVPLEAMACGCPVASSFAPAMPEILGEAALFFNPYMVDDIAKKIRTILDEKRDKMIDRERLRASREVLLGKISRRVARHPQYINERTGGDALFPGPSPARSHLPGAPSTPVGILPVIALR